MLNNKNEGIKIFILSGPAGAGKTTLLNLLFRKNFIKKKFIRGISYTTRKSRPNEKNGKDYFFVSKREFLKLKKQKFFLETQKVLDNYYGTPKYFYDEAKQSKKNLILCIDVKGGMYLKKRLKRDKIITIFISAPDKNELFNRLEKRTEKTFFIKKRLSLANKELKYSRYYDYLVINKKINVALDEIMSIILKEMN
ncbi:MAG: guanylate kinase [Candidatus Omnitrophica bacterium]|nr:guanylate kinase [Candidatus Omnitrophota bacterium]MCM8831286.1 guanylate kinase [Candidatus Omnitrophota bacterium]